jgi:hypothetical protein
MGAPLFLPRRLATAQPQQVARIDWSNSLARGLLRAYHFGHKGVDAVSGGAPWTLGASGGGTWGAAVAGRGLAHTLATGRAQVNDGLQNQITAELTVLILYTSTAVAAGNDFLFASAGSDYNWGMYFGDTAQFFLKNTGGAGAATTGTPLTAGATRVYAATYAAGAGANNLKFYDSGRLTSSATQTGNVSQLNLPVSSQTWNGGNSTAGTLYVAYVWNRALSPAEVAAISANPWQLFAAPPMILPLSASSPIVLAASAASAAAGTAVLATQIALSSSAAAPSSASATLTAGATALSSAGLAQSSASASLSTQVALAAASQAGSSAASTLATQLALGAGAASATSAGAALATQIPLAADARSASSGSASLTVGAVWAASSSTSSSAVAVLTTAVSLGAAAQAPASAGVALSSAVRLAASAVSNASGAAALSTQLALTAIAAASTSAAAALSTAVALAAVASSRSAGNAALTVVPVTVHLSVERTFVVPPQSRLYQVPLENRCFIL